MLPSGTPRCQLPPPKKDQPWDLGTAEPEWVLESQLMGSKDVGVQESHSIKLILGRSLLLSQLRCKPRDTGDT